METTAGMYVFLFEPGWKGLIRSKCMDLKGILGSCIIVFVDCVVFIYGMVLCV